MTRGDTFTEPYAGVPEAAAMVFDTLRVGGQKPRALEIVAPFDSPDMTLAATLDDGYVINLNRPAKPGAIALNAVVSAESSALHALNAALSAAEPLCDCDRFVVTDCFEAYRRPREGRVHFEYMLRRRGTGSRSLRPAFDAILPQLAAAAARLADGERVLAFLPDSGDWSAHEQLAELETLTAIGVPREEMRRIANSVRPFALRRDGTLALLTNTTTTIDHEDTLIAVLDLEAA